MCSDFDSELIQYKEIIDKLKVRIEVVNKLENIDSYLIFKVLLPKNELVEVPVFDEYNDAKTNYPFLLLHLLLVEIEEFEESTDFLDWSRKMSLNASKPEVLNLFKTLNEVVPKIRKAIGYEIQSLPTIDFQLNSGVAYYLRNLKD